MKRSRWIWYRGDFEIYHSLKLHSRRDEFGFAVPPMWELYTPYPTVSFDKTFEAEKSGTFKILSNARGFVELDGVRHIIGTDVSYAEGKHTIHVLVTKPEGLPCIFCESDDIISDSSWICAHNTSERVSAGDDPAYEDPKDNPEIFNFSYDRVDPVCVKSINGGVLYDFGRELFAKLDIQNTNGEKFTVYFGESDAEALSANSDTYLWQTVEGEKDYSLSARAFRYVFIPTEKSLDFTVYAEYEYIPFEYKGDFKCEDELINKIWDISAYTFHLNAREFFLDGIKRDRWVWSGDAYQSYMINEYLFLDYPTVRRTITALRGKDPINTHINTINDYSLYLIIGTYDYYFSSGDDDFIKFIYPRIKSLCEFIISRLDENGFVVHRAGDWIFIDWSNIDKHGAPCAEQMLLYRAMLSMKELAKVAGDDGEQYGKRADELYKNINKYFWNEEKGAFIDSYTSGRNHVTRHANIFAILYDLATPEQTKKIVENVINNPEITQITTPYFKFFETDAVCKTGDLEYATNLIRSYWGDMVKLGATSIWEQYIPEEEGEKHYSMYGMKYGKSLCHAWGGGPVYIFGKYFLGVTATSVGAETFEVRPNLGNLEKIKGSVPLNGGIVKVELDGEKCRVYTDKDGGTLVLDGKKTALKKDGCVEVKRV